MKGPLSFTLAVALLLVSTSSVHAGDCTPAELQQLMAAQQDPSVLGACATLVKDPSKPVSLTNIDICKSPSCITAIKGVVAGLPDCTMSGVSISATASALLGSCAAGGRPPPGPGGMPPPGPGGMPPPGPGGLPPPGAGGLPPPGGNGPPPGAEASPTREVTKSPTEAEKTDPTTAPTPTVAKKETVASTGNDTATVKPADTDDADMEEAGDPGDAGSGSGSEEEDTSIVAPKESASTNASNNSQAAKTPAPTTSAGTNVVLSTISSIVIVALSVALL